MTITEVPNSTGKGITLEPYLPFIKANYSTVNFTAMTRIT